MNDEILVSWLPVGVLAALDDLLVSGVEGVTSLMSSMALMLDVWFDKMKKISIFTVIKVQVSKTL